MKITEQMVHNKIAELIQHALDTNKKTKILFIWALINTIIILLLTNATWYHINKIKSLAELTKVQQEIIEDNIEPLDEIPEYEIDITD